MRQNLKLFSDVLYKSSGTLRTSQIIHRTAQQRHAVTITAHTHNHIMIFSVEPAKKWSPRDNKTKACSPYSQTHSAPSNNSSHNFWNLQGFYSWWIGARSNTSYTTKTHTVPVSPCHMAWIALSAFVFISFLHKSRFRSECKQRGEWPPCLCYFSVTELFLILNPVGYQHCPILNFGHYWPRPGSEPCSILNSVW